ncbi:MAG: SIS domain-containing protein [Clostridiales bacterium]|nr:SIS domain-containing protein [Clostridiales bacterium]
MTALYNLGVDPFYRASETDKKVLWHFDRLFERYPALVECKERIMDAYLQLRDCFEGGGKLLVCGNGGSCADAEHIVGELMKGFYLKRPITALPCLQGGLPAISLNGHPALSSAFANDCDGEYVYAQQLAALGRKGDVLLGISTSGNAKNVLRAAETAKALGIRSIALTGGKGGRLAEACDISVIVPANTPADVQEYHLPVYHALCAMLESHFFEE